MYSTYIQQLTDLRASSISIIKSGIPGIQKVFGGNLICRAGLDLPTLALAALEMRHALSGFEVRWQWNNYTESRLFDAVFSSN
jgi:hypothetical protein